MSEKYEYYIYNCINSGGCKNHVSFHMPGHKGGGEFLRLFPEAPMDITELSFSDNLHCPTGVIRKAQEDIAKILGAYASYITTDGSTSGVYTMIYTAAQYGKKIIIPRNAHKSVYNACKLFNIEPIIVQGAVNEGVMLPPAPGLIEEILANDGAVSAVLAVSPDYYGNFSPLEQYKKITQKYKKLLLVDGAHGAHLAFEVNRRGYCGAYADMWVDGAHKTLPTLTQGAVLNIASAALRDAAGQALSMFRTTSPSYPIMASVEYGVKYFANNPEVYDKAKTAAEHFKNSLNGFTFYPSDDWCKIAVDFKPSGVSPEIVAEALERENIYPEMCDGRYILFYISPLTSADSLEKLSDVLQKLPCLTCRSGRGAAICSAQNDITANVGANRYAYLEALSMPWEYVALDEAEGRICAENAGITPPCVPLVAAGEAFTSETINILKGGNTFGVKDGKVKAVKL